MEHGLTGRKALMATALGALVAFWIVLLTTDRTVSPVAFTDVPDDLLLGLAGLHVLSALAGWGVATASALSARHIGRAIFALGVVPVTAVVSMAVLMTDALVWRDDLGAWLLPLILALLGPLALGTLLAWSLARATGREGVRDR